MRICLQYTYSIRGGLAEDYWRKPVGNLRENKLGGQQRPAFRRDFLPPANCIFVPLIARIYDCVNVRRVDKNRIVRQLELILQFPVSIVIVTFSKIGRPLDADLS